MKNAANTFKAALLIAFLAVCAVQGGGDVVFNGSFENDGSVDDTTAAAPRRWTGVNVPAGKFRWWVDTDWSSDRDHSLTMYTEIFEPLAGTDMASISQNVYIQNATELIFDVRLGTLQGTPWNPAKRTARVMIDDNVVWDSTSLGADPTGRHLDVTVPLDPALTADPNTHTLSLVLKSNVNETEYFSEYLVQWDLVRFDRHCEGFGYLPEDLNLDCIVNMPDYAILADRWLAAAADWRSDLSPDGFIDELDLEVLVAAWLECTGPGEGCFFVELLAPDLNDDGIVDYLDLAAFFAKWLTEEDFKVEDLDGSGFVDFGDYAVLADTWRLTSWLYGL
jgi:hypothetical protein